MTENGVRLGGSAKAFRNERIELTWYANKKSLLFQGILGNKLKESMINSCKNNDMALDANPNSDKPKLFHQVITTSLQIIFIVKDPYCIPLTQSKSLEFKIRARNA